MRVILSVLDQRIPDMIYVVMTARIKHPRQLVEDTQDRLYLLPAQLGSPESCGTMPQAMSLREHIVAIQGDHKPPLQPDGAPADTPCEVSIITLLHCSMKSKLHYSARSNLHYSMKKQPAVYHDWSLDRKWWHVTVKACACQRLSRCELHDGSFWHS